MPRGEQPVRPQLVPIRAPGSRLADLVASGSVLFVGLSILIAALGPDRAPPRPVAPSAASSPGAGQAGSSRPEGGFRLRLFGPGPYPPAVLVRAPGRLLVDLSTGRFGPALDAGEWPDEWFQLGDDRLVCLCRSVTAMSAATDEVTLVARVTELDGTLVRETPAGTWLVRRHGFVGEGPDGYGLQTAAGLSRDGASLVVGHAALGNDAWQLGVTVVDLTSQQPPRTADLETLPLTDPSRPEHVFAPVPQLSPAGDAVVLRTDDPCCRPDARAWTWSARIGREAVTEVRAWPEYPAPPKVNCRGGAVARADLYVALCFDELADAPQVVRFSLGGKLLGRTSLASRAVPTDLAFDPARPRAYVWSGLTRTLSIVDLVDGRLRSAITVPIGEDTPRAADVVEGIRGSLAPPAAAPLFTEPALAQSRDGARLYAVGLDISAGRPAPAMAGTYVFDTATEEVLVRWTLDRDISSIRLNADGSTLLAALMPVAAADGRLDREATIVGLDAQTGELRLVAGRLGAHPLLFLPDP